VPAEALARARSLAASGAATPRVRRVDLGDEGSYLIFMPADDSGEGLFHRRPPPSPLVPLSAGLLASLAFGALLAWYVARPVRHLRAAFASLAEGRLDTRVAPRIGRRRDEVADLGHDFDRMAQRLQALIGAQRSLLHDVSHELRSPLARLQAAIGLARQNPQKVEGLLERIEREAVRVDDLVGQLLTLSRLEAGAENGHLGPRQRVDLMDLVATVAADAHFEAQASGRSVVFTGEDEVLADVRAELLHRAFENVVRNAVQHTGPGSSVEVRAGASPAGDAFLVSVADRGPGVPPDELEAVFEPFFRSAESRAGGGFGLGLAITRRAVEAHGGHVRARNRDGGGLVVEVVVPLVAHRP
jgi:two-component system OmpR family sensor kinase